MLRRDFCVNIVIDGCRRISTELWILRSRGFHSPSAGVWVVAQKAATAPARSESCRADFISDAVPVRLPVR